LIDVVALGEPLSLGCCAVPDVPVACCVEGRASLPAGASFRRDEQSTAKKATTTLAAIPFKRMLFVVVAVVFIEVHPFWGGEASDDPCGGA
jgi:hypothetical protein